METTLLQQRRISWVLGLSMLFVGICGISYEYGFSKLASDVLGDTVRQWAIIIGLMMLCMGLGADLQKRLPDAKLLDAFILIEMLLALAGGLGPTVSLYFFGQQHDYFLVVHYALVCSVGLFIGLEIPLLSRVNQWALPDLKENLGLILKMDYIGSFLGALVWVFVLPRFFPLLSMNYFLGLVNLGVALATAWFFWPRLQRGWLLLGIGLAIGLGLMLGLLVGEKIEIALEQKLYKDRLVHAESTAFQRILIAQRASGEFQLYLNGHLQFDSLDEHIYHELLVHAPFALLPKAKRVLILGGGDGLAAREVLKYPIEELVLVDLDPGMTRLAMTHPLLVAQNQGSLEKAKLLPPQGLSKGERLPLSQAGHGFFREHKSEEGIELAVMNLDAYEFVEGIPGRFDVILLDFPDPSSLNLSKLYSQEFYTLLKARLVPGGVLIQQAGSPAFAKEAFLMVGRTMQAAGLSALPLKETIPSFGPWGFWLAGHQEIYGEKGLAQKLAQVQEIPVATRYLTPELLKASRHFGKEELSAQNLAINRLLEDQIVKAYLEAWQQLQN